MSRNDAVGAPANLTLSGPWSGYYLYAHDGAKHRMKLGLTFASSGTIEGEGIDDIAPVTISGFLDTSTNQAYWTKSYIGMHSVEYYGLYDGRSISGNWTLRRFSGGFRIWPSALEDEETVHEEIEEPIEAVLV
jgi:hypothetical protein